jgi:DNA-binding NtrC family response regulator
MTPALVFVLPIKGGTGENRGAMMSRNATILVVEHERVEREALQRVLRHEDYHVLTAEDAEQAIDYSEEHVDLVLSDVRMGAQSGTDLLRSWKKRRPETPFILVTADGDLRSAMEGAKLGAHDYLTKPVNPSELLVLIERSLKMRKKDQTIHYLSERTDDRLGVERIIGRSKPMLDVFARVRRAARAESNVLVCGESGTGKELIAEAIHQNSPRKHGPFVAVNMAAVPASLAESELFGHIQGAFTGATATRVGRFEAANGGTIFIDEIGDFALESQAKLLRVLETRTITPVGSNEEKEVDVRVVAATARDLEQLVAEDVFREDLYYRLSVVTIALPALRDRRADIPLLVRHFLDELCRANNRPPMSPNAELMRFLKCFHWPGNVRQLANCLESMVVMATSTTLTMNDLPANIAGQEEHGEPIQIPPYMTIQDLERHAVKQALQRHEGNRTRAARSLGISVRTLQRKLKAWQKMEGGMPRHE